MNMSPLLNEAERLLDEARFNYEKQVHVKAERCLVALRELLNSQPELEAGGSCQKEGSS